MEIDCPICKLASISQDHDQCPQCESDLTCFRILDALPEPGEPILSSVAEPTAEKDRSHLSERRGSRMILWMVFTCCFVFGFVVLLFFQEYRFRGVEKRIFDLQKNSVKHLNELNIALIGALQKDLRNAKRTDQKSDLSNKKDLFRARELSKISPNESSRLQKDKEMRFFIYTALRTDTLWQVAQQFYGSGRYYPVLLAHNPHIAIHQMDAGDPLFILQDKRLVKDIYNKITEQKNGKLFFIYTLQQGDTLSSIIQRYSPLKKPKEIICTHPDQCLTPGKQIKIMLE